MGCILEYATKDREEYRQQKPNSEDCPVCKDCFSAKQKQKVITHRIWKEHKDIARKNKLTSAGKKLYKVHCLTIKGNFGDTKELHGFGYARFQGLKYIQMHAYFTLAYQNMKDHSYLDIKPYIQQR